MGFPTLTASQAEVLNKLGAQLFKGTGLGNYTTTSTAFVAVDATNLSISMIVPRGFIALISTAGVCSINTAAGTWTGAIFDGATELVEQNFAVLLANVGNGISFGMNWVVQGDNAAHTFQLQYKTSAVGSPAQIFNSSATHLPVLIVELTQSNF